MLSVPDGGMIDELHMVNDRLIVCRPYTKEMIVWEFLGGKASPPGEVRAILDEEKLRLNIC